MTIVKPSVEIITEPDLFKRIELAARTCYKSEGKMCEGSDVKLFNRLVASGHESALEHSCIVIEMDVHAYSLLEDILGAYEYVTGLPHYIRHGLRDNGRIIVSGNLRAWRSLCKAFPDDWLLCRIFKEHPAFQDIPLSVWVGDIGVYFQILPEDPDGSDRHTIVTARFTCDRGVSHELVRHRCISYSQESTRYVNYKDGFSVVEPWWYEASSDAEKESFLFSCSIASETYQRLIEDYKMKPQAARCVLPTALKTEVVATGTVEQWKKQVLPLRMSQAAHPDIRRLMTIFCEKMNWKEFLK